MTEGSEDIALSIRSTLVHDEMVTRRVGEIVAASFIALRPTPWLLSDHVPSVHPRVLRDYFTSQVKQVEQTLRGGCGRVEMVDDEAVAVWVRSDPVAPPRPPARYEELLSRACGRRPEHFEALEQVFEKHHPSTPVEHLVFLAVRSPAQRSGSGTALLLHDLARLDEHGRSGILEATTAADIGFYERHGFPAFPLLDSPVHSLRPYLGADRSTPTTPMIKSLDPDHPLPRSGDASGIRLTGRRRTDYVDRVENSPPTPMSPTEVAPLSPRTAPATRQKDDAPAWVPADVDPDQPSVARVYDYLLGGGHNFAADRALAERITAVQPNVQEIAQQNRAFLRRAVLFMLDAGIRQFLDLGSGIPTVGNVHEIAQQAAPGARVVYVDYEAVAVSHSRLLLADNPDAAIVGADITHPEDVLDAPVTRRLLDFDQPIGLLAITIGHYIPDTADPVGIFARYRDALVPGSYLALSHLTDDFTAVNGEQIVDTMKSTRDKVFPRGRAEVLELFTGFDLVEPGLVTTSGWRPDFGGQAVRDAGQDGLYVGVGQRR
jgi:GNAT superfamily N-acetyltransferase